MRAVFSARRRSLTGSGAVTTTASIWLAATVRALTAERRATRRVLIASTHPSALLGTTAALPLSAARRCLRVDGVGLAAAAAHLAVRAVHIDDVDAGSREVPGEARAVGAGLHADALDAAVAAEPSQQRRVAGGVRVERGAAQDPSGAVEDGGDMGVLVGVDPAEYGGVVLCHDGDASLWSSHCRGRHRPRRRTEHSRCGLQGSYRVTSVGPVGARPADQRKPTDPPQGTTRGRLQLGSDPLLPTGPNHYECCK